MRKDRGDSQQIEHQNDRAPPSRIGSRLEGGPAPGEYARQRFGVGAGVNGMANIISNVTNPLSCSERIYLIYSKSIKI